jgi:glutathione peroxidase-family protein
MKIGIENNFYKFSAISLRGNEISMDAYRGKVIMVVNSSSKNDRNGVPVKRYSPSFKPENIAGDIERLLGIK